MAGRLQKTSFIDLLKQPWFAISPSPWSLAFYAIMGIIGGRQLLKQGAEFKRFRRISAFLDALFILGIIVFLQDTIWLLANTWKWIIPQYLGIATFTNYWIRFPQNIVGALFFWLVSAWGEWKAGMVSFKLNTLRMFSLIAVMTCIVFALAPNQAWTDWTFAVSHAYSDQIIVESFIISHVGYKILIALAYLTLFQWGHIEDKTTEFKKASEDKQNAHEAAGNVETSA
jgi:hypothetical protein